MNDTTRSTIDALDQVIQAATNRSAPDVLLFSGGLDSTLLAALWQRAGHRVRTVTIGLDPAVRCSPAHRFLPYPCNSDLTWAEKVARTLDLDWTPGSLSEHDALEALDWLLVQQRSFDLGQLNNIPLIAGLQAMHGETFATGDDGDGLFGGYRFLQNESDWPAYIRRRIPRIDPPARSIGVAAGWAPTFPYLDPNVLEVARTLTASDLWTNIPARERPLPPSFMDQFDTAHMESSDRRWGKVILRRVAERYLPQELAWRPKTDLQFGSGMCALEHALSERLNPGVLMNLNSTGIRWFNDAHRGLYLRFRTLGLTIPPPGEGEYACISCGGGVPIGKRHCAICGCWPADDEGD